MSAVKKLLLSAGLVAVLVAFGAAPAVAASIVGQAGGASGCFGDSLLFTPQAVSVNSYVVPAGSWRVKSWSTQGGVLTQLSATASGAVVILRPTGVVSQYTVVAVSATEATTLAGLLTFATDLPAQGGDIVGLWVTNGSICANRTRNTGDLGGSSDQPKPQPGQQVVSALTAGFVTNVSASLEPATRSPRGFYCTPNSVQRTDGTSGMFVDLVVGQQSSDSKYGGATPALYGEGYGATCDALLLRGFKDAGYKVDLLGRRSGTADDLYEYFTKP